MGRGSLLEVLDRLLCVQLGRPRRHAEFAYSAVTCGDVSL